jgi:uncharacterized protein (TIGR01777 family)
MRIFITGGTGLVGSRLITRLLERQDHPVLLTRRAASAREKFGSTVQVVEGDPMQPGAWQKDLEGCDAVINLVGENLFNQRWNDKFKALMIDSRIKSTTNVVDALRNQPRRADGSSKVLVNASAIGWYGPHGDEVLTEQDPPGNDFLARLSVDWERTALAAKSADVRVALVRIGIVLDPRGGALAQMLTPFKLGMGGPVASGKQWMSWIHHEDLVGIFLLALDRADAVGPLNGTAPNPVTNRDFSTTLGHVLHRPSFMPLPAFALRLRFGEVAEVVVNGQRVLPRAAEALGYSFQFPGLEAALRDALK